MQLLRPCTGIFQNEKTSLVAYWAGQEIGCLGLEYRKRTKPQPHGYHTVRAGVGLCRANPSIFSFIVRSLLLPNTNRQWQCSTFRKPNHIKISGVPGASVRNSAHGKGHEEGGLAYTKAWSSLRKPPVPEHLPPKPESVLCSHLHLWLYGGLSPITVSLGEGVNMQLQSNKNSWAWQECFSLRTPLKVI